MLWPSLYAISVDKQEVYSCNKARFGYNQPGMMTETIQPQTVPLTRIQKLIGRLMLQSKQNKACGYLSVWVDLTEMTEVRREYCRKVRVRATTNDFFFLAVARAVKKYPRLAATLDAARENFVIGEKFGVGFAVAAPQGLVVPVLQDMGQKTLIEIAGASEILVAKARANKLTPDDFDGANVVLTGLGMFGIHKFYAIAPPSATAIVSLGLIEDSVVPMAGELRVCKMMDVALAFDRQIVDEFYAGNFLRHIADQLEDPWTLTR
jgi:pyruvate dehydrogenase E2 component (dihydrolipoamide acetyltransferase)